MFMQLPLSSITSEKLKNLLEQIKVESKTSE